MPVHHKLLLLLAVMFLFQGTHSQQLQLALDTAGGMQGTYVEAALRGRNFREMLSAQGTIGFDPQVAQFDSVMSFGLPGMSNASFGMSQVASGRISFSWDDASLQGISLPDDSALFTLRFLLTGAPGTMSGLYFPPSPVLLECSDTSFAPVPIDTMSGRLTVEDTTVGIVQGMFSSGLSLEIWPHPVDETSRIRLRLSQAEMLKISLWNVTGTKAGEFRAEFEAGERQLTLGEMFPALGAGAYLLICQGDAGGYLIRKMITR